MEKIKKTNSVQEEKEPDGGFAKEFIELLHDACLDFDIHILSDDKCCRLLAWLYVYGGGCEAVTMNIRLNKDILYAQKRLNLFGGARPNGELVRIYQEYLKSISDNLFGAHNAKSSKWKEEIKNPPEWVRKLEKEYKLKIQDEAR